ncbi:MAG: hydroxymethylbilane synthase [Marivibrio sp.]|uniref:hydroxymethylbilane synthase n=1 Tax=Marivibrio sp. TaxID=2039719 RepID=UPI0032EC0C68
MTSPIDHFSPEKPFVLGTRGSPLAMAQAYETRDLLARRWPDLPVEIREIKVSGDAITDRPLAEVGGKGLFTKELDRALLEDRCTAAVHSMKDMETILDPGVAIGAVLEREDPRDAWLSLKAEGPEALPRGATVGSASLRRKAQLKAMRPDLDIVLFRGNVQTRLKKLADGVADATMLAMAGLTRLDMVADAGARALEPERFLPAVAQGAICIARRIEDEAVAEILAPLSHADSLARVTCERAYLEVLDGSCHTPIAGLAELTDGTIRFRGLVAREDGTRLLRVEESGPADDSEAVGREAGRRLKAEMGDGFFD